MKIPKKFFGTMKKFSVSTFESGLRDTYFRENIIKGFMEPVLFVKNIFHLVSSEFMNG